jgi:glycosidase
MNFAAGTVSITADAGRLRVEYRSLGITLPGHAVYVALGAALQGCAAVPYEQHREGSTVLLPIRAGHLFAVRISPDGLPELWRREWRDAQWTAPLPVAAEFAVELEPDCLRILLPSSSAIAQLAVWARQLSQNGGWGYLLPNATTRTPGGWCDQFVPRHFRVTPRKDPKTKKPVIEALLAPLWHEGKFAGSTPRPRIYQLLPRLFSNTNETRKPNGTLTENGVGKFADLTDLALGKLRDELSITHVWLTGVLAQATATDYAAAGKPADDPDLLKGIAGSPYAVKDCGDVCPDYALDPAQRIPEFQALLARSHAAGLRVIIDLVPNHVARSHPPFDVVHDSPERRPDPAEVAELTSTPPLGASFGEHDDRSKFFSPTNNFFWLQADSPGGGPPLRLPTVQGGAYLSPTCEVLQGGDGHFAAELTHGRVTGNNAVTWSPGTNDWYETVKLNYGFDFTTGARVYPHVSAPAEAIPATWEKMAAVIERWQELGVDGFRCDMAHMVPPEFWQWVIARARARDPAVLFIAEAYNNDPAKVESGYPLVAHFGSVMIELLNAGFNAVYDDPAYKALKSLYDGSGWANDLDNALGVRDGSIQPGYVFHGSLRYAENHDEVRLASRGNWGNLGLHVGRPVAAVLYGLGRGPVLLYSGQEVGEPAVGTAGFASDNGRTTIFDYWSMPEMVKWVNGHRYDGGRLSPEQKELRAFYGRLLKLCGEPAFRDGEFFPLNTANLGFQNFGRLPGEPASGHWLYAFLRADTESGSAFLVVANFHPHEVLHNLRIRLTPAALAALLGAAAPAEASAAGASSTGVPGGEMLTFQDRLGKLAAIRLRIDDARDHGIPIVELPPLSAAYFSVQRAAG